MKPIDYHPMLACLDAWIRDDGEGWESWDAEIDTDDLQALRYSVEKLGQERDALKEQLLEIHRVTSCVAVPPPVREGDCLTTRRVKEMATCINLYCPGNWVVSCQGRLDAVIDVDASLPETGDGS